MVYYALTEKGNVLVNANKKIVIVLGSSALALIGGFAALYSYLMKRFILHRDEAFLLPSPEVPSPTPQPEVLPSIFHYELIIGILLITLSVILFFYSRKLRRKI